MSSPEPLAPEDSFRLREYLGVLRVRKWSIIVIALFSLLAALFYLQRQTPLFTSSARVLATNPLANFAPANSLAAPNMDTESSLVASTQVSKCAYQLINQATGAPVVQPTPSPTPSASGAPASPKPTPSTPTPTPTPVAQLTPDQLCSDDALVNVALPPAFHANLAVTVPPNTNVLVVSFTSPNRGKAQIAAQAFANAYIEVKTLLGKANLTALRAPLLSLIAKDNTRLTQINAAILRAIANGDTATQAFLTTQFTNLSQQVADLQSQVDALCDCK